MFRSIAVMLKTGTLSQCYNFFSTLCKWLWLAFKVINVHETHVTCYVICYVHIFFQSSTSLYLIKTYFFINIFSLIHMRWRKEDEDEREGREKIIAWRPYLFVKLCREILTLQALFNTLRPMDINWRPLKTSEKADGRQLMFCIFILFLFGAGHIMTSKYISKEKLVFVVPKSSARLHMYSVS